MSKHSKLEISASARESILTEVKSIESGLYTIINLVSKELTEIDDKRAKQAIAIKSFNQMKTMVNFNPKTDISQVSNYKYHPSMTGGIVFPSTDSCRNALADMQVLMQAGLYASFAFAFEQIDQADNVIASGRTPVAVTGANTVINNQPTNNQTWTYYIKRGDTLSAIAKRYNTTVEELCRLNNISNPNMIIAGAALLIPLSGVASGNASSTSSQNSGNQTQSSPVQPQGDSANAGNSSVNVPYYSQGDSRWSGKKIGTKTIGNVGCLVTSLAMAESSSTNTTITPDQMLGKLKFDNNSLYWSSAEKLGYNCESCPQTTKGLSTTQYQTICEQLKKGHPVVIGGAANGNDKGNDQHWVVITGYNGDGTSFSPSDFTINDPGRSSRKTLADFFNYKPYPVRMLYKNG